MVYLIEEKSREGELICFERLNLISEARLQSGIS
jgi:hypothetical protein